MMTMFRNKAVETVPAPEPQPSTDTLQSRLTELRSEAERIEAELSAARSSVRIAEGSVSAAEADCVVTGDAQTLRSAHEGHQAALRAVAELSERLAQTRRLTSLAGEMLAESQRSNDEKYRRELEDRGRAGLRQFLEYLAGMIEASQAFVAAHGEAFERMPHGSRPGAPAIFYVNTNLVQRLRLDPNSQAIGMIREVARQFPDLVPESAAALLERADEIQRERDREELVRNAAIAAHQERVHRVRWPEMHEAVFENAPPVRDTLRTVELPIPVFGHSHA